MLYARVRNASHRNRCKFHLPPAVHPWTSHYSYPIRLSGKSPFSILRGHLWTLLGHTGIYTQCIRYSDNHLHTTSITYSTHRFDPFGHTSLQQVEQPHDCGARCWSHQFHISWQIWHGKRNVLKLRSIVNRQSHVHIWYMIKNIEQGRIRKASPWLEISDLITEIYLTDVKFLYRWKLRQTDVQDANPTLRHPARWCFYDGWWLSCSN